MLSGVFLTALIFIILLAALPLIFKFIFKTKNFMGYGIGLCCSIFTLVTIFGVLVVGFVLFFMFFGAASKMALIIGAIIFISIFIIFINYLIFLFIFNFIKEISKPNQPYNSVFMFIAGYFLPIFAPTYIYFIVISLGDENREINNYYISRLNDITSGILLLYEFFFLFNMIQLAGIIMLSMLHHRKVNKKIYYILIGCYIAPTLSYIIEFSISNKILLLYLLIPNVLIILAPFIFGVFFYCKYANHEYTNSEILEPINI